MCPPLKGLCFFCLPTQALRPGLDCCAPAALILCNPPGFCATLQWRRSGATSLRRDSRRRREPCCICVWIFHQPVSFSNQVWIFHHRSVFELNGFPASALSIIETHGAGPLQSPGFCATLQ